MLSLGCFLGETAAVPVLQWSEGKGVADGVSHSVHQGDRWPCWKGRSVGGPEKWPGESSQATIHLLIQDRHRFPVWDDLSWAVDSLEFTSTQIASVCGLQLCSMLTPGS